MKMYGIKNRRGDRLMTNLLKRLRAVQQRAIRFKNEAFN